MMMMDPQQKQDDNNDPTLVESLGEGEEDSRKGDEGTRKEEGKGGDGGSRVLKVPKMMAEEEAATATNGTSTSWLDDDPRDMTYGRRLALWLMRTFPGRYGPQQSDNSKDNNGNGPSLEQAWAFFEHVTLERYLVVNDNDDDSDNDHHRPWHWHCFAGNRDMPIAEPGQREYKSRLYPVLSTPLSQLGKFGIAYGTYFTTLRNFAIVLFVGGCLSITNIVYFANGGEEPYDGQGRDGIDSLLLKGSAICTDRTWVPCPTCTEEDFDIRGTYKVKRFLTHYIPYPTNESGYYLNVTDYLNWMVPPSELDRDMEHGSTIFNSSSLMEGSDAGFTIQTDQYNLSLRADQGYIYNDINVTAELGYTPLYCGIVGGSATDHCYLDLYPFEGKRYDEESWEQGGFRDTLVGDTRAYFLPLYFAQRNNCNGANEQQGSSNITMLGQVFSCAIQLYFFMRKKEVQYDEDVQTAQDYSIVVKNPPPDANDPEEWKEFFEHALTQDLPQMIKAPRLSSEGRHNKVTVVTTNVKNELLMGYLIQRRNILHQLETTERTTTSRGLPAGANATTNSSTLDLTTLGVEQQGQADCDEAAEEAPTTTATINSKLVEDLKEIEDKIREFFQGGEGDSTNCWQPPVTTRIYITFETEAAQRHVLSTMSMAGKSQSAGMLTPYFLFRGKHILEVKEPDEPSAIVWQHVNTSNKQRQIRKLLASLATLGFVAIAYLCIRATYEGAHSGWGPIVTTIFTIIFPPLAAILTNLERHGSETSLQMSLFYKIVFFNVLITTVLPSLTFPFLATLDQQENSVTGLIPPVHELFVSQITMTPLMQMLDISGNLARFVSAPFKKTQEEMNQCFLGSPAGEQGMAYLYANMMKLFVMSLWYSAIYPVGLFMGTIAMIITYYVDRFSLMRSWTRSSQVGSEITLIAWKYFVPLAMAAMSVVSAYYWSGFPYDNLCEDKNATLPSQYVGDFRVSERAERLDLFGFNLYVGQEVLAEEVSVLPNATLYKYCNQDLRFRAFPALPQFQPSGSEWMTEEQEEMLLWYSWTTFATMVFMLLMLAFNITQATHEKVTGKYEPRGEDQNIDYSDVAVIDSYIPQVKTPSIAFPLVLCNVQDLNRSMFNWQDPQHPHSYYDLTQDVAQILGATATGCSDPSSAFAQVRHWGPPPKTSKTEIVPEMM